MPRRQILIANLQEAVRLPLARLRKLAAEVIAGEKLGDAGLSIAFVNRKTMRKVNRRFLKHDFDTDVLAFPPAGGLIGEIVISTDFAVREARQRKIPVIEEVSRYLVHGILHLAGYDDHKPAARARMWKRQEDYLKRR
jgi:probable rRNA maturation factor